MLGDVTQELENLRINESGHFFGTNGVRFIEIPLCKFLSIEKHIYSLLPQISSCRRYPKTIHVFLCRTEYFKNFFFPYVINQWNTLNPNIHNSSSYNIRGGSRTAATSKMKRFVIIVNGFHPLTIIKKRSILELIPAVNYYQETFHLGCCSSPRSASASTNY